MTFEISLTCKAGVCKAVRLSTQESNCSEWEISYPWGSGKLYGTRDHVEKMMTHEIWGKEHK